MAVLPLHLVLRQLRRRLGEQSGVLTDAQLLDRFVRTRDEAAFEVLVWRHGPAVLGVCRRLLGRSADVEDAFQGTFLVLVRKAAAIRDHEALGSWLYKVAYRVALRLRTASGRREQQEEPGVELVAAPSDDPAWSDLRPVLDEEVSRLPARYRGAFVLCYLQGRTNEEAASELGCPVGTVASRLSWARDRLRKRLTGRGVVVSATLFVAASHEVLAATVPPVLANATLRAALLYGAGQAAAGVVSVRAASVAEGVIRTMVHTKLKMAAAALLTLSILGAGAGIVSQGVKARPPADGQAANEPPVGEVKGAEPAQKAGAENQPPPKAEPARPKPGVDFEPPRGNINVPSQRDGIVLMIATEIKPGEKWSEDWIVSVQVGNEVKKYRRLQLGDKVEEGQLLARIEDDLAVNDVEIARAKIISARADLAGAQKLRDDADRRRHRVTTLLQKGTISAEEVSSAETAAQRYANEVTNKEAGLQVAELELKRAQTILKMYEIRSRVRGTIRTISKHPGEAVKALEPVLLMQLGEIR